MVPTKTIKKTTLKKRLKVSRKASKNKEDFENIKKKKLSEEDRRLINEFLDSLEKPNNNSFLKLTTKRSSVFKKQNKGPLKYKPIVNVLKLLVKIIRDERVNKKTLMKPKKSLMIHKILYHNETIKEAENDKIISVPISHHLSYSKINEIFGTLENVHTYLIKFDYYSKDEQFIDTFKKFENDKDKEDFKDDVFFNENTNEKGEITTICCDNDVNYSSKNHIGKISLSINGKNNHVIFTLILFGDNDKGIILDFFTTSEYKDYIQRTNKDTRFYSWYKNDPSLFLKNLLILIKDTETFNEDFDFFLNYHVFDLNESLKSNIINNSLTLKDLFNIILKSKEYQPSNNNELPYQLSDFISQLRSLNLNSYNKNFDPYNQSASFNNLSNLQSSSYGFLPFTYTQNHNSNNNAYNFMGQNYATENNTSLCMDHQTILNNQHINILNPTLSSQLPQNLLHYNNNIDLANLILPNDAYTSSTSKSINSSPLSSAEQSPLFHPSLSLESEISTPNQQLEDTISSFQNPSNITPFSNNTSPLSEISQPLINTTDSTFLPLIANNNHTFNNNHLSINELSSSYNALLNQPSTLLNNEPLILNIYNNYNKVTNDNKKLVEENIKLKHENYTLKKKIENFQISPCLSE